MSAELAEALELRRILHTEYRCLLVGHGFNAIAKLLHSRESFLDVISLFGPMIHAAVANRYAQRDMRLIAEASDVIANMGPGAGNTC